MKAFKTFSFEKKVLIVDDARLVTVYWFICTQVTGDDSPLTV